MFYLLLSLVWNTDSSYKNINHQQVHKEFYSSLVTHYYMFRPCWVIFRDNFVL
jgi:hypothetical protein